MAFGLAGVLGVAWFLAPVVTERARGDREWVPEQAVQATVAFAGDTVTVRGVRDTRWRSPNEGEVRWSDRTYDLASLNRGWFVVEPLSNWDGMAHTLYSFQFGDEFLVLSVEARREVGESYGVVAGARRQFELIYVLATEQDVLGLRAVHRGHPIYLYPIASTPEQVQAVFRDVAARANALAERPEFYHSLFSTCTTNVVDHVNAIVPGRVPRWSPRVLMPGYSDGLAYDLGLVDTSVPLEELRAKHDIGPALRAGRAPRAGD